MFFFSFHFISFFFSVFFLLFLLLNLCCTCVFNMCNTQPYELLRIKFTLCANCNRGFYASNNLNENRFWIESWSTFSYLLIYYLRAIHSSFLPILHRFSSCFVWNFFFNFEQRHTSEQKKCVHTQTHTRKWEECTLHKWKFNLFFSSLYDFDYFGIVSISDERMIFDLRTLRIRSWNFFSFQKPTIKICFTSFEWCVTETH